MGKKLYSTEVDQNFTEGKNLGGYSAPDFYLIYNPLFDRLLAGGRMGARIIKFPKLRSASLNLDLDLKVLIKRRVPELVQTLLLEINKNYHSWSQKTLILKIQVLRNNCPHTLALEWERVRSGNIIGYMKVCLICRTEEEAQVAFITKKEVQKPIYMYRVIHARPVLVTRIAGNFLLGVFKDPLQHILHEIFDYKRKYREAYKKSRPNT